MTKRHFVALADTLRTTRPHVVATTQEDLGAIIQWKITRDAIADFCQEQNPQFNRPRWYSYIDGECGPSGGSIKPKKAA